MNMLKQTVCYSTATTILFLIGCAQPSKSNKEQEAAKARLEASAKSECFQAIDEQDVADLKLISYADGTVKGNLLINYAEKGKNDGTIEGKYSGDTLFVDYTFKIGTQNTTVYKNPLALLKYGDSLILGVGQIETHLGKSYLVKDKPIRFDRSKFTFAPIKCK